MSGASLLAIIFAALFAFFVGAFFFACFLESEIPGILEDRQVERFNKIAERMKGDGE